MIVAIYETDEMMPDISNSHIDSTLSGIRLNSLKKKVIECDYFNLDISSYHRKIVSFLRTLYTSNMAFSTNRRLIKEALEDIYLRVVTILKMYSIESLESKKKSIPLKVGDSFMNPRTRYFYILYHNGIVLYEKIPDNTIRSIWSY